MYAIVRSGGRQHRVEEGRTITVDRLSAEEGAAVELGDVLLIADDGQVTVGTPTVEGARVLAQVEAHGRDKKIIVFKYKSKVRTRKKTGHRQRFTRLAVQEILRPGQQPKAAEKPKRRRRSAKGGETPTAEMAAEAAAPKRRTRRAATAKAEATAAEAATPKRRTRRAATPTAQAPAAEAAAPRRRTRRAATPKAEGPEETPAPKRRTRRAATPKAKGPEAETPAPKRRTRRAATPKAEGSAETGDEAKETE